MSPVGEQAEIKSNTEAVEVDKFDCPYKGCLSCSWVYYKQQLHQATKRADEAENGVEHLESEIFKLAVKLNIPCENMTDCLNQLSGIENKFTQANEKLEKVRDFIKYQDFSQREEAQQLLKEITDEKNNKN